MLAQHWHLSATGTNWWISTNVTMARQRKTTETKGGKKRKPLPLLVVNPHNTRYSPQRQKVSKGDHSNDHPPPQQRMDTTDDHSEESDKDDHMEEGPVQGLERKWRNINEGKV